MLEILLEVVDPIIWNEVIDINVIETAIIVHLSSNVLQVANVTISRISNHVTIDEY